MGEVQSGKQSTNRINHSFLDVYRNHGFSLIQSSVNQDKLSFFKVMSVVHQSLNVDSEIKQGCQTKNFSWLCTVNQLINWYVQLNLLLPKHVSLCFWWKDNIIYCLRNKTCHSLLKEKPTLYIFFSPGFMINAGPKQLFLLEEWIHNPTN